MCQKLQEVLPWTNSHCFPIAVIVYGHTSLDEPDLVSYSCQRFPFAKKEFRSSDRLDDLPKVILALTSGVGLQREGLRHFIDLFISCILTREWRRENWSSGHITWIQTSVFPPIDGLTLICHSSFVIRGALKVNIHRERSYVKILGCGFLVDWRVSLTQKIRSFCETWMNRFCYSVSFQTLHMLTKIVYLTEKQGLLYQKVVWLVCIFRGKGLMRSRPLCICLPKSRERSMQGVTWLMGSFRALAAAWVWLINFWKDFPFSWVHSLIADSCMHSWGINPHSSCGIQ